MHYAVFVIPLLVVGFLPLAFGEIVETKGQNYDLVENFFIGEAVWESHPERIMDGGWQNYALSNTADKVIFNTNAVGSFVFDKNSCSYSIYGNGFDGEQIIPSVSAVATYLNNGQWQNLPINDEACTVTVERYNDGVFLKSTKVITEDITEDVFIDYIGTTENFYGNATNSQFTLVTNSTGNVGYFNGETRVLESVEVEKFVQEIDLNIHKGFKETFKVTHDGNQELGISQTIHTGESITIGDQTINIAELNGQSFDRQFIIDNEAEILQLTDSLRYDFDTGIDSLSNINIIFDGDYKVNMDFTEGNFVGYLEIDPTISSTTNNHVVASTLHNTIQSGSGNQYDWIRYGGISNGYHSGSQYTITGVPSNAVVTGVEWSGTTWQYYNGGTGCELVALSQSPAWYYSNGNPSTFANAIWNSNTNYVTGGSGFCHNTGGNNQVAFTDTFNAVGIAYANTQISNGDDIFFGHQMLGGNSLTGYGGLNSQTFTLAVTYELPTNPASITDLSSSQDSSGNVNLSWTLPNDNNSAITSFKIYRDIGSGYTLLDTVSSSTLTSYQDTNPNSTVNGYKVNAVNGVGEASDSNVTPSQVPDTPTNLSTVIGIPIELDWSTGTTGEPFYHKVFRTLNEFALTELPNNSANANGVDFTDNEFLLHGFESIGGTETTITDNFSSNNGWTSSDTSKLDIANNALQIYSGTGVHYISKDLTGGGEIVGDFTVQYEATYTTLGSTSLGIQYHGVSDSQANAQTAQDELFLLIYDGANNFQSGTTNDGRPDQSSNQGALSPTPNPTTTTYYIELERSGADWITNVYSDSGFSNSIGTRTVSDSSQTGLRYFTVQTYSTGDYVGSIDNFSFTYTPVVTQILSDKSTNSISITRPVSNLDEMNDSSLWTQVGTDVEITGGKLVADFNAGSDHRAIKDVGVLSDTFVTHFDFKAVSAPSQPYWTMFAFTDDTTVPRGTNDGVFAILDMGSWTVYLRSSDGNTDYTSQTGSISLSAGNQYYVTYTRDSTTSHSMSVYNDEARTSQVGSTITATNGGTIDGLQYFQTGRVDSGNSGSPVQYEIDNLSISDGTTTYALEYAGTSTTGVIDTGLQSPNLSYTDTNLPDGTDDFSIGSWVKLDVPQSYDSKVTGISDLLAYYDFEQTGTTLTDQASNLGDGTSNGGVTTGVTGKVGNAWSFDGSNDQIDLPTTTINTDFSVSVWVKDIGGDSGYVLHNSGGYLSDGHFQYYDSGSAYGWRIGHGISPDLNSGTYSASSDWQHVVWIQKADGTGEIWVDGSQITSGGSYYASGSATFTIGSKVNDTNFSNYSIDELALYTKALSSSEIALLSSAPIIDPNTKLLGLNDVTFNVGTTSASVSNLIDTNPIVNDDFSSYTTQAEADAVWETPYSRTNVDIGSDIIDVDFGQTYAGGSNNLPYLSGTECATCLTLSDSLDTDDTFKLRWKVSNVAVTNPPNWLFEWGMGLSEAKNWNTAQDAVGIKYRAAVGGCSGAGTGWYTFHADNTNALNCPANVDSSVSMGTSWIEIERTSPTDGTIKLFSTSDYTATPAQTYTVDFTGITNLNYINFGEWDYSGNGGGVRIDIDDVWLEASNGVAVNTIISATGLTDNTSSPQHYTFTRDGNDWEIYQNGVSEATATDSTSLGSNVDSTLISDNFTTDNWTDSSKMYVQNGILYADGMRNGNNYSIHRDLGETLEDDFIFRSEVDITSLSVGSVGYGKGVIIGLSDTDDSASDATSQDSVSIYLSFREANGNGFYGAWSDNAYMSGSGSTRIGTEPLATGLWYIEIAKSGSEVVYSLYSDSSYSTLEASVTETGVTAEGLQYVVLRNENGSASTQSGNVEVEIDDMTITQSPPNYTTNIDGMIDEYFIDSTALTSTEIDQVYENGKPLTVFATTGASTTDYDDNTVVGGNAYYYSVKATNAFGDSDFLTPFVSGLAGTPPQSPTGVSTTINNPNTNPLDITVSWSAPSNVGSGTLNAFEIYRDGTLITTTGLVTTYTDTVPSGGGTFVYSMKAVSTHGTSGLSGTSSITTPSIPDTPAAPTGSINDPNGSPLDITVSWTAPNAGGSAIINYDLYRSSTSGSGFTIVQSGVSGLTHTDTTPSAGTWYYTIAANNLVGSSLQSPELSVSTPTVPSVVSDLAGSTVSDTAINLTWSAPNNGGSNIIDYTIYRDGVSIDTVTTPGYSDTGLIQQTSYTYTVYARNNVGTSLVSNSISQETHGVPAVVPSFQATSAALDTITLSWTEPNDYNSAITNYVIERESPIGGGFQPLDTVGTVTTYSDTGLTAVTEYNYRIKAVNAYGNSPTTTASTITLPAPPTNVFVTPSSSTSELTITWDEPTLTTGITGYQLQRENGIGNGFTTVTTTSGTSHLDTGLTTNIFYNYRLVSVSVQGNSDYSNTYAQTTFHLPDPVTVLSATAGTVADVTLDWAAPSIPYAAILGYTIYNVDAPGTTASATATLSTTLDQVSSITITDGGTQYSVAPTVTVSAPTGQLPHVTATATAAITNGVVTSITVTNNGDGYNTIPTVTLTSPSVNTAVSGSTTLTPFIVDTGDITTSRTITGLEPSGTHNFAIAPITIHGSSILNAAIVSISPDVSFEGIVIDMPDEINPNENAIKFVKTQVGNNTNLTLEYNSALDVTCETTNPFSATTNTYPNLAETSIGNGKVTHTIAFNDSQNSIVDVMCYDVNDPTIKGQQRIQQNVIPLKDQMDDFNSNTFGTGSSFAAIDLMTLIVVIVGMIGFNRKNPAVGLALMAGLIGILTYFQVIELETSVIGGFTLVVFLAIAMGLKRS